MRVFLLAAALALLAGCGGEPSGPPKIDGASKEAAEASIAAIDATLPPDKRAEFDAAIEMGWGLSEIAGKSADEVIALARAKKIAALKATTIPALQAKIPEAEKAVELAEQGEKAAKTFLRSISLLKPDFSWRESNGTPSPLLTFNMQNGSSEAIQTIVFNAVISSPGAAKPWIDQRFEFKFAEAVTTGETKFVFVKPDMTLPGNADALESRAETKFDFKIDFVRVADLNGRVIMDDEGPQKAEAELQAAKEALAAAETELKRLEAGGSIAASPGK